ncbi:MAG: TfoX/Sxy family protein [Gemmataceae bacterium]
MGGVPIQSLRNLGPASAGWLRAAGVNTVEDLKRLGPVAAYRVVLLQQPGASLNLLWALVAGLDDRDWRELSLTEKQRLRQLLDED